MLVQKTVNLSKVIKYIKVVLNTYYLKYFLNQFNSHFVTINKIRRNEIYYIGMPFISWPRLLYCGNGFFSWLQLLFRGHDVYFVELSFISWPQLLFRGNDVYFLETNFISSPWLLFCGQEFKKNLEHMSNSSHCVTLNPAQDCLFLLGKI